MKYKDRFLESYGIDGAKSAANLVFHDLKHTCSAESLQYLCRFVAFASLGEMQRMPEELSHWNRKRHQVPLAASNPDERLLEVIHT